jgi:putative transcriptional regulator
MPINHHASDQLLLTFAAGHLSAAPALVVASHLAMSAGDAGRLKTFEQLGGVLLDEQPMVGLSPDLFDRTLSRLDDAAPVAIARQPDHSGLDLGIVLPRPLAERQIGKWRTLGPGVRFAEIDVPEDPKFKVVLLRVGANRALPQHGHSGSELTLVLKGVFGDEGGRYGPGDLAEEDEATDHQPMVGPDDECICVTAIEGRLRPKNWLARAVMPLFGF